MKNSILFSILLGIVFNSYSQNIFNYEGTIKHKERFLFKEIIFKNHTDRINLSGTLITPKEDYNKVIVIIPGSGRDTRHSHYVLTEEFLKNNIAVFRFDDRGVAKSEGWVSSNFSVLANDLSFALEYLRSQNELQSKKIGVLGHSLGGMASIEAYKRRKKIDFLVQWSTPIQKGSAFLKYQIKSRNNLFNAIKGKNIKEKMLLIQLMDSIILNNDDINVMYRKAKKIAKKHNFKKKNIVDYIMPSFIEIVKSDYEKTYENMNIPLLYVIGDNDKFINPTDNINLLKSFNNTNINTYIFKGLNHYLKEGELTSMHNLYNINNKALSKIVKWVNNQ